MPFRNYDAALGRFFQVDPLSHADHTLTPYHYAGNNPINSNDPTGLMRPYETWQDIARQNALINLNPYLDFSPSWYNDGGFSGSSSWSDGVGGSNGGAGGSNAIQVTFNGVTGYIDFANGDELLGFAQTALSNPNATANAMIDGGYMQITNWYRAANGTTATVDGISANSTLVLIEDVKNYMKGVDFWETSFGKGTFAFMEGFYDGPKSNLVSMSGASGGWGMVLTGAEMASEAQGVTGMTRALRTQGKQAGKFLGRVAGPSLGLVGVLFSSVESYYDEKGWTWGDTAKTVLGLGLVGLAFTVAAPAATVYALADIGVGVVTGTSITDRIGNGIDSVVYR